MPNLLRHIQPRKKKSPKGIKTAQKDIDLIKKRYKAAVEQSKENK